jgi:hypothetical protein
LLVTSGEELTAIDTATGQKLWTVPLGLGNRHNNRTYPVVSQSSLTVYAWRLHNGEAQLVAIEIDTGEVADVLVRDERKNIFSSPVISPDENLLAYMVDDNPWQQCGYLKIISTEDHSEVHVVDVRPETTTASFSPDSQSFWLRSSLGLARFDLASGSFEPVSRESLSTPHCMTFSRDGTRLFEVTGVELRTWDLALSITHKLGHSNLRLGG